jgi:hypothetical protein
MLLFYSIMTSVNSSSSSSSSSAVSSLCCQIDFRWNGAHIDPASDAYCVGMYGIPVPLSVEQDRAARLDRAIV